MYRTKTVVKIPANYTLALSAAQATARSFALEAAENGCFHTVRPICFKAGEVFGCAAPLGRALEAQLERLDAVDEAPIVAEAKKASAKGAAKGGAKGAA